MKSIKLNLGQMSLIYAEIFGNQQIGTKGIANSELSINAKFKLYTLAKNLQQHVEFFQEENKRLVGVHGTTDDNGNFSIDPQSEGYLKFIEEMNNVAMVEHEVKVPEILIEDIGNVQSTEFPAYLFELINKMSE